MLLVIFFLSGNSFAQTKYDLPQFWRETGNFFSMPAKWSAFDIGTLALLSSLTAVTYGIESPAREVKFTERDLYYSPEVVGGRIYGEPYTPLIVFAGYEVYSLATGSREARKIGFEIAQSSLYTAAIVTILKISLGRARPFVSEGKFSFEPFLLLDDSHHSFPSGHTAEAFSMSTIFSMNANQTWLKILAYVPAFLTAFSRMYQGWHWGSDCLFGAGIGYFVGKWITDLHGKNEAVVTSSSAHPIVSQLPTIYPISFTYRF